MSTLMAELPNKTKNKNIKYMIMRSADVIKIFEIITYERHTCQTKELTERAWKTIENISNIFRKSRFYENFYS